MSSFKYTCKLVHKTNGKQYPSAKIVDFDPLSQKIVAITSVLKTKKEVSFAPELVVAPPPPVASSGVYLAPAVKAPAKIPAKSAAAVSVAAKKPVVSNPSPSVFLAPPPVKPVAKAPARPAKKPSILAGNPQRNSYARVLADAFMLSLRRGPTSNRVAFYLGVVLRSIFFVPYIILSFCASPVLMLVSPLAMLVALIHHHAPIVFICFQVLVHYGWCS